jgi:hypothetical protein
MFGTRRKRWFASLQMWVFQTSNRSILLAIVLPRSTSNKMPPLDIALMLWTGLLLYFVRSAILKDMLMVVTIGFGFAIQAVMLGLIYFV